MDTKTIQAKLKFIEDAAGLKDVLRSGYTSKGRKESTAEHTWRLCLMVLAFESELKGIDILKLIKLCIIHDLGEVLRGDIPATDVKAHALKASTEREDLSVLLSSTTSELKESCLSLWDEYTAGKTPEAQFAKGLDKLETLLQHTQGKNPETFDYGFNLSYGKSYTDLHPLLTRIRDLVDEKTRAKLFRSTLKNIDKQLHQQIQVNSISDL